MATGYSPDSSYTLAATQRGVLLEAELATPVLSLFMKDPFAACVEDNFPQGQRGSDVTLYVKKNTTPRPAKRRGTPIVGNATTRTDAFAHTVHLDYQVIADGELVNVEADQQNVWFDIGGDDEVQMQREAAESLETQMMNQLSGYTPANDTSAYADATPYGWSCNNACTAPDTNHHFYANGNSTEAAVAADTNAIVTDRQLNEVISTKLATGIGGNLWPMAPGVTPWGTLYTVVLDPEGFWQVRENSTESDVYDLSRAMIEAGADPESTPIWAKGAFICREKILYLQSDFVTFGATGETAGATTTGTKQSNVKRGLILGAQAAYRYWGEGWGGDSHLGWATHKVLRQETRIIDTCWGMKATIADSQRWGSAIFSYYVKAT